MHNQSLQRDQVACRNNTKVMFTTLPTIYHKAWICATLNCKEIMKNNAIFVCFKFKACCSKSQSIVCWERQQKIWVELMNKKKKKEFFVMNFGDDWSMLPLFVFRTGKENITKRENIVCAQWFGFSLVLIFHVNPHPIPFLTQHLSNVAWWNLCSLALNEWIVFNHKESKRWNASGQILWSSWTEPKFGTV